MNAYLEEPWQMTMADKLSKVGPKKLLTCEGGGIRGVLALEILVQLEKIIRERTGNTDLRLCDYFDSISGTSTGAIIAAGLALGMSANHLLDFYLQNSKQMFDKAFLLRRFYYRFEDDNLVHKLKEVIGENTLLGSERISSLLMIVMRNASTDSPWPVSNNPYSKYNDPDRSDNNLLLPLWQLVRASTAAPTYFPPEVIYVGQRRFLFQDGGVTMYNNPSFITFLMATVDRYWVNKAKLGGENATWPAERGTDRILLVSVGTGSAACANEDLLPQDMNLIYNATSIPGALMFAAENEQDMLCRIFGECRAGEPIDRELDTLIPCYGPVQPKLFSYVRYSADLSREGLTALGCGHIKPENVQKMDDVNHITAIREVGRAVAEQRLKDEHFAGFV